MSSGFANDLHDALPNASFIGFTGTPIEKTDANTRAVFGAVAFHIRTSSGLRPFQRFFVFTGRTGHDGRSIEPNERRYRP